MLETPFLTIQLLGDCIREVELPLGKLPQPTMHPDVSPMFPPSENFHPSPHIKRTQIPIETTVVKICHVLFEFLGLVAPTRSNSNSDKRRAMALSQI